jgi:hypothetical protein
MNKILKRICCIIVTVIISYYISIKCAYIYHHRFFMNFFNRITYNGTYLNDYNYRLNFYTKNIFPCVVKKSDIVMVTGGHGGGENIHRLIPDSNTFNYSILFNRKHYASYFNNIQFIKSINKCRFVVLQGDVCIISEKINYPVVVKTYSIYNTNHVGVLLPLNIDRHWNPILSVEKNDIPYHQKIHKAIWRGVTTGISTAFKHFSKADRIELVTKYYDHPSIDVGFNIITSNFNKHDFHTDCFKSSLSMKELLRYKYLIVVEGNDKASCLQWMLYSKSVVLMPKITCISWFMEHELVEYEHFIPLKNDFEDLEEKLEWCMRNDERCKRISMNATKFVTSFCDVNRERQLIKDVLDIYAKNVKII